MSLLIKFAQVSIPKEQVNIPQTDLTSGSLHTILQIVFGLAGGIALIVIMLAALRFVLATGDPQKTAQARNTIIYALVGLGVCVLGFSIVTFVLKSI